MATPKTNKDEKKTDDIQVTSPAAEPLGGNTNPTVGEPIKSNVTEQEAENLKGEEPKKKATGKKAGSAGETPGVVLRLAAPSRLSIAATIAAGMLGQGRYTALLRDDRMVQDLAVNSLRVADALIAAAEPQA